MTTEQTNATEATRRDASALQRGVRQHTPGPWSSRGTLGPQHAEHLKGPCVVEVAATGRQLAILSGWRTDTQRADASLMAAAPAMADALDCIVRRLQLNVDDGSRPDQWTMEDLIRTAKAALPAGWVIGAA
ncbi:MAG: hypothetical protein KDH93_14980 [Rhodoferax sp.]|mgnify:CR=1 FL=1|nr:hypothetical protein [Rhodoferax sp.]MCP5233896.1 hypothetical protein [Zoogloeaceae bacterium]